MAFVLLELAGSPGPNLPQKWVPQLLSSARTISRRADAGKKGNCRFAHQPTRTQKPCHLERSAAQPKDLRLLFGVTPDRPKHARNPQERQLFLRDDVDANRWISPRKSAILDGEMSRALELPTRSPA